MAENKISNSRVGTDRCQHFWPASGYVYTAASHSQYSWDCNILEQLRPPVNLKWGFWHQENRAGAGTAWIQLSGYSGSRGAAKPLIPELARIKLAWDCLWLQCSLGSNWPWFSTTPNAEMWVLTHSMVRRATQGLWRHRGNHSSPTQGRIYTQTASNATGEVYAATGQILSATGYIPEPSLTGYYPIDTEDGPLFARALSYSKTLIHRSE